MSNTMASTILFLSTVLSFSINSANVTNVYGQSPSSSVNWGEVCRTFDLLITEPCETLTTADGYTLTSEGSRVFLVCIGGSALATLLGYPEAVLSLGSLAKCGATSQKNNNMIDVLLKDFFSR